MLFDGFGWRGEARRAAEQALAAAEAAETAGIEFVLLYAAYGRGGLERFRQSSPAEYLNQVERFFAKITEQRIRRESFRSVQHLREAILDYIHHHNKHPKPFNWTASAEMILGKVDNFCMSLA